MKHFQLMVFALVLVTLLAITSSAAFAQNYITWDGQNGDQAGPENIVYWRTYLYAALESDPPWIVKTLKWNADNTVWPYTNHAMAQWNSDRPSTVEAMIETGVPSEADLLITYVNNLDCPSQDALGCWKILSWAYTSGLNVNMWQRSNVQIKNANNWASDGLKSAVAHEIGHALGMRDKYGFSGCSSDWFGIMDRLTLNSGGLIIPCDTVNPTVNDHLIWKDYHLKGYYWPDLWSQLGNGQVTMMWKDYAYQDWWMEAKWKWSSQPNGTYTDLTTTGTTLDNGTHQDVWQWGHLRVMSSVIPINNGVNYKWLKVCTKPVFNYAGDKGTEQCYGPVWYQHPR